MYFNLNIGEWEFENNYEDIYFLLHCLYNAKTELYDRTLTDMRSRYDPTEAFIDGRNRSRSNWYSKKLYDKCVKCIELKTRGHFVHRHWKECVWKYEGLSAQGWINLYHDALNEPHWMSKVYTSEEEAKREAHNTLTTVKIEWEEYL